MNTDLDHRPDSSDPELEQRLRTTLRAVMPHLVEHAPADVRLVRSRAPRGPRLVTLAAGALLLAGGVGIWAAGRHDPDVGEPADSSIAGPTPSAAGSPLDCSGDLGCSGFDRLAVVPGVSDYYVGPAALGEPTPSPYDPFENGTRCAELATDNSRCAKLAGIRGTPLVTYRTNTEITVDTTDRSLDSYTIGVGTTFSDKQPADYAAEWTSAPGSFTDAEVRGHGATRFEWQGVPAVVWSERPGVLVWVSVPPEMSDQLSTIAEGVRRTDGPPTIPFRVEVPGLDVLGEGGNDSGSVVAARAGGVACVGLGYIDEEHCGGSPAQRTIIRQSLDPDQPNTFTVAGSAPAGTARVRIEYAPGSTEIDTVGVPWTSDRFYAITPPSTSPIHIGAVVWLDAAGKELGRFVQTPGPAVPLQADPTIPTASTP